MLVGLFALMFTCTTLGILAYEQSILIYSKNTSNIIAGIVALITMSIGVSLFFSLEKIIKLKWGLRI